MKLLFYGILSTVYLGIMLQQCEAQSLEVVPRSDVTILAGAGFPIGDYSGNVSGQLGHASTGFAVGVEGTYHVIEFFDLALFANLNYNGFDEEKLAEELGPGVNVSASHYLNTSMFGGVGFNLPQTQDIKLYGRGYLGVVRSTSPEITMTGAMSGKLTSSSAYAFAYSFCAGVSIFAIDLSVRYIATEPTYEYMDESGGNIKVKQPIGIIQLSLGYKIPM